MTNNTTLNPADFLADETHITTPASACNTTPASTFNTTPASTFNTTHRPATSAISEQDKAVEVARRIAERGIDITSGYQNWVAIGFALADGLGEGGRDVFHQVSKLNAEYDATKCNRQFDHCLKSGNHGITIATFYQKARDVAGVDLAMTMREMTDLSRKDTSCAICAIAPLRHGTIQNNNKNHNILIYDNLDNNIKKSNVIWRNGASGASGANGANEETGYTFSDKLQKEELPSFLSEIFDLSEGTVNRDKMTIGTLNAASGLLGAASGGHEAQSGIYGLYDGRRVYAPIYNIIFANAGSAKGDLNFCRQLVKPLKDEMRRSYEAQQTEYERQLMAYEANRKQRGKAEKERMDMPAEPVYRTPFVPGNSSSSAVYRAIDANGGWGMMFETEADTVSAMISSDYGNYSDLMRKAFHHETISMSRVSEKLHIDIDEPRLSVLLTCTPGQLQPLFPNWENGLGSRFFFYQLPEEEPHFNNVFANRERPLDAEYQTLGTELLILYHALKQRTGKPLQFIMSSLQQQTFLKTFSEILSEQYQIMGTEYKAFIYRLALGCFRYAMVLTTLRRLSEREQNGFIFRDDEQALECDDRDFRTAMVIVETLANHTARVYTRLAKETENPFADRGVRLTPQETDVFNNLPDGEFRTADFNTVASRFNISKRTATRLIGIFCNAYGILIPTRHGHYRKATIGDNEGRDNMSADKSQPTQSPDENQLNTTQKQID